jgi:RNA polymerase sigma factor for flagellar operon FliA
VTTPGEFGLDVFVTNPGGLLALLGDESWSTNSPEPSGSMGPEVLGPDVGSPLGGDVDAEIEDDSQSPDVRPSAEIAVLLREHWTLPDRFVAELHARLPLHVPAELLLSAARRGLWTAARRFDASRGVPFASFAKQRVAGAIVDELRAERLVFRRHRTDVESGHLRAMLAACSYDARFDELTGEEVAWVATWRNLSGVRALPVRAELRLAGAFDEDALPPDEQLDQRRMLAALEEGVAGLEPVQRKLVERVAFDGCTLEEAARPLSKSWASRLFATAVATLKRAMVRAGYVELFAPGALSARATLRGVARAGAGAPNATGAEDVVTRPEP